MPLDPWSAVVLAGGKGIRLGGVVKPLIRVDGQPIICGLVRSLQAARIRRIVVVVSPYTQKVCNVLLGAPDISHDGLSFVQVAADADQMHSLSQGLMALDEGHGPAMVCLADQPSINASLLCLLQSAFDGRPVNAQMVVPIVDGQPGNPVVLSSSLVHEWRSLRESHIGKAWRNANKERVYLWDTPFSQYTFDLDTPEDLTELAQTGRIVVL